MAVRARLTAPREARQDWPWHEAKTASVKASTMFGGDRRMEAENYLARASSIRAAIEGKSSGWMRLKDAARTWQPSRLKGIQVGQEFGTPFLAATQMYDLRPVARKWLSFERTDDGASRYVSPRTIVITCSGDVGRATLTHASTNGVLISHDLLRVDPLEHRYWGWIYAYLRSPTVRNMMKAAQYGHMIKHLEVEHLDQIPLIEVDQSVLDKCNDAAGEIIANRDLALDRIKAAESLFSASFQSVLDQDFGETGFSASASHAFMKRRRRFDAWNHNPLATRINTELCERSLSMTTVEGAGYSVWLPNRFKRIDAKEGLELIDSSSIFEINPDVTRRISAAEISDRNNGEVKKGWLMMSRSGQVYGLLGSVAMATEAHEGKVVSDDVIRIASSQALLPDGYLYVALGHPLFGRPRVKALAYGSSIPHIDEIDLANLPIPRLQENLEAEIGRLAIEAVSLWASADALEKELGTVAEAVIGTFINGNVGASP